MTHRGGGDVLADATAMKFRPNICPSQLTSAQETPIVPGMLGWRSGLHASGSKPGRRGRCLCKNWAKCTWRQRVCLRKFLQQRNLGKHQRSGGGFSQKCTTSAGGGGIFLPYCILHEEMKPCLMYCSVFRKYRGEFLHGPPSWDTSPAESIWGEHLTPGFCTSP